MKIGGPDGTVAGQGGADQQWGIRMSPRAVTAAMSLGGLHGMVNNVGIYIPRSLLQTDAALFERHMRVNQLGCFLGMRSAAPTRTSAARNRCR
jgi:NAD(P)-dependent dehydrogenase (short-subunit alcohol dehydrogenase family)